MPSDLLLVRHGQTDWNLTHRIQGSVDTPLNATGLAQAAATADAFIGRAFDHIVSSQLERAAITAAHINATQRHPLHVDARLAERGHGEFEGWTWKEVAAHVGEEHADEFFQHSPKLEAWDAVQARMLAALTDAATAVDGGTGVVVSHGGAIKSLIAAIRGVHYRTLPTLNNCSITHLRFDGEWTVVDYNNVAHLPDHLRT